jgi:hypothetical protein
MDASFPRESVPGLRKRNLVHAQRRWRDGEVHENREHKTRAG